MYGISECRRRLAGLVRGQEWVWILVALFVTGNIVGWLTVGVHPDEAYYWVWSERLQTGYFDHPPMVAWVIRLFTGLLGDSPWVIRLPAILAWLAINLTVFSVSRDAFPRQKYAGSLAVLVATSLPLYQIGFHVVTPDSPYLFFTALSYWALYRALTRDPRWWLVTGLFVGLSLLGKYVAVLFPAAVFLALVSDARGRKHLLTPWPWIAILIAILLFIPVVYWNAQHQWISFLFQLGHGIDLGHEPSLINVLLYIGSQLVMAMPWVLIAMIVATVKSRQHLSGIAPVHAVLTFGFGFPLVFFAVTGFTMISGAHWPAAAYIPGAVLLGGMLAVWLGDPATNERPRPRRWPVPTIVIACLLSMSLAYAVRYHFKTQLANTYGWPLVGAAVKEVYDEQAGAGRCAIVTDHKLISAAIAFALNMPHRVQAYPGGKINQYDVWRDQDKNKPSAGLCVLVVMSDENGNFARRKQTTDGNAWRLERTIEIPSPIRKRWAAIYVRDQQKAG